MSWILSGLLFIASIILYFKYQKKQEIDRSELEQYKQELFDTSKELNCARLNQAQIKQEVEYEKYKLEEYRKDIDAAQDAYNNLVNTKMTEIDKQLENLRQQRNEELQALYDSEQKRITSEFQEYNRELEEKSTQILNDYNDTKQWAEQQIILYEEKVNKIQGLYQSLLDPIKQYQKDRQEKLFYTIQLPEEFQDDIEYLLTTVAAKVQHPDIISKLVWAEYVKPNLDDTFKRIEIKSEPGIYKLTSLETDMSYIGKSTDVKKRIADHFKSSVGIRSIADQAVHHAILKEGFWNWTIEVIQYCDKDDLNELEKYYIDFFKTQEFGYNKNVGGGG